MLSIRIEPDRSEIRIMKAVARALISLNGAPTYVGQPATGYNCEFDIVDLQGKNVLWCTSSAESWWHGFMENRTYVLAVAGEKEVARIIRSGFLGRRCVIIVDGVEVPYSSDTISLPGATIGIDRNSPGVEARVTDAQHTAAYLGIAFYMWARQCLDDAYNG